MVAAVLIVVINVASTVVSFQGLTVTVVTVVAVDVSVTLGRS